ncbi:hypothetical protein ACS0TY_010679 [Phlomoides rotata]
MITHYILIISSCARERGECMAANLSNSILASFGKRFVSHIIRSRDSLNILPCTSLSIRRSVHVSVYDKNPEEHVPADDVISAQSDNFWGPHPHTGVFGPAKDHKPSSGGIAGTVGSVLEQKAFFRPLEDLDKPLL